MSIQPRRIRLKPWLLAQVDSGRYPGLHWLSPDHRLFQVPWKHATRHTPMLEEENTIFKAWALETGKYQEGVDEPDPAKWKANLRCALNKSREFQLKYDGTKETPVQPYKIYEVCEQPGSTDGVEDDDEEMPNLMDLTINPRAIPASFSDPFSLSSNGTFGPGPAIAMPLLSEGSLQMNAAPHGQGNFISATGLSSRLQDLNSLPPSAASAHLEPDLMEASHIAGLQNEQNPYKYDLLSSVPLTDLDLKFQYRGRTMNTLTVSNPQGCRLYYGHLEPTPEQVDLFGPITLQQVLFPGTAEIQNQKQRFYTDALLDVMERGLILEIWEQDIYAIRLCQCKVFWSGPGVSEQGPPNPMEREMKIKVFSLNEFLQELILFQKGDAPNPPPFEIYFCFGEDWPDKKPKEKKLILVQLGWPRQLHMPASQPRVVSFTLCLLSFQHSQSPLFQQRWPNMG
ncbi:interferon regulatory factor 5 isoform 2-T3 [Pholidichthys leucotaenia]